VDSTAAGDAFTGALAVARARGLAIREAIRYASAAGALAVTRPGAQPSLPRDAEVRRLLGVAIAPSRGES
jgi:ribokinase